LVKAFPLAFAAPAAKGEPAPRQDFALARVDATLPQRLSLPEEGREGLPGRTTMTTHYAGGCAHVHVTASAEPIDNHECHCNVCKSVTGQQHTHVAFFNHGDIQTDHPEKMKRVPFNAQNPDGPLEICLCTDCGAVLMLDDKQKRIRVAVPNVMGYDDAAFPKASYHAFWDETKGYPAPSDGRPVYAGLRPEFHWPAGA
jgi:hypothetical protein